MIYAEIEVCTDSQPSENLSVIARDYAGNIMFTQTYAPERTVRWKSRGNLGGYECECGTCMMNVPKFCPGCGGRVVQPKAGERE